MISRRNFIKSAAVGAISLSTVGILTACGQQQTVANVEDIKWDKESDVVIVGGGGTGVAAAAQAAFEGVDVLILEKSGIPGGTTNLSGGVLQAAGTKYQKELTPFKDDTPEKHAELWIKSGEELINEDLVKDLAQEAPEHIEWLSDLGLKFTSIYGHCHVPYIDNSLAADRIHVYEGGGMSGQGTVLVSAMLDHALAKGGVIEYNTEVTKIIMNNNGEVVGVMAKNKEKDISIKANKGVVLAASSIDHNINMAKELSPQHYWDLTTQQCLCVPTNTGDGIRMAMEIGAAIEGFGGTIDFCAKTGAATDNRVPVFPSFIVNQKGNRFVCEDATYAYHYRAIFQQEKQLNGPTYMIFGESSLAEEYAPWTNETLEADMAEKIVFKADTIEELAKLISVNPSNLADTMSTWNFEMETGKDNQFDRITGLKPIEGPFYAYKNVSANLGAIGGVKINTNAEVLKPNGEPIPHLFAGGLNAGGWIGPYYPGSGTAIIGAIHWGRKAGLNAAKSKSI